MTKHRHEDRALFVELRKLLLHPSDILLGSLGGRMHRVVGEVEKEWLLLLPIDECHGFLRQSSGEIAFVISLFNSLFVAIDRRIIRALHSA